MPRMDTDDSESKLVKELIIGDGKVGKTHFAGMAAKDGFNVLYMDADVGGQTLTLLPPEAKKNLYLMHVGDKLTQGTLTYDFAENLKQFTSTSKFVWDDTNSHVVDRKSELAESEVWEIRPGKLDHTCVLVIDSWTSLVNSVALWAARTNGIDLAEAKSSEMRDVYRASSGKLTQFLVMIQRMPCHVIVIAHPDEYQKMSKPEGLKIRDIKETDMKVEWTKLIPKSSSKPHAMTMAKYFTDVGWLEADRHGNRLMNFRVTDERIAGGHFDDKKGIEEYSFANLVRRIGGDVPTSAAPTDSWLTIHPVGAYQQGAPVSNVLDAKTATESEVPVVAKKGFAALVKNQATKAAA